MSKAVLMFFFAFAMSGIVVTELILVLAFLNNGMILIQEQNIILLMMEIIFIFLGALGFGYYSIRILKVM